MKAVRDHTFSYFGESKAFPDISMVKLREEINVLWLFPSRLPWSWCECVHMDLSSTRRIRLRLHSNTCGKWIWILLYEKYSRRRKEKAFDSQKISWQCNRLHIHAMYKRNLNMYYWEALDCSVWVLFCHSFFLKKRGKK